MDFNLLQYKDVDRALSDLNEIVNSVKYMSPEQFQDGSIDQRSDLYSLGALLYKMLTMHSVLPGGTYSEVLKEITNFRPVPPIDLNNKIPYKLNKICLKAIAKEPRKRYQTATAFIKDLERFSKKTIGLFQNSNCR